MYNVQISDEQARLITIAYIVKNWDKNKDHMVYDEHLIYFKVLKEFANHTQMEDILSLFIDQLAPVA